MTSAADRRRIVATLTLLATLVAASVFSGTAATAQGGSEPPSSARERSQALTREPSLSRVGAQTRYASGADARVASEELAKAIPLPPGGSFAGVRFEEVVGLSDVDIVSVLHYNAACQWLRALRDGRERAVAQTIVGDLARWPAFRDTAHAAVIAAAAEELSRGRGETAKGVLADCDAIHAREVDYARRRGVTPSG